MEQVFLTMSDVQDRYGVSRQTVTNWINKASFPTPIRVGRSKRWNMNDICAWEKSKQINLKKDSLEGVEIWKDEEVAESLKSILKQISKIRDELVSLEPKIQNLDLHRKILYVSQDLYNSRALIEDIQALKNRGLVLDYRTEIHTYDELF